MESPSSEPSLGTKIGFALVLLVLAAFLTYFDTPQKCQKPNRNDESDLIWFPIMW